MTKLYIYISLNGCNTFYMIFLREHTSVRFVNFRTFPAGARSWSGSFLQLICLSKEPDFSRSTRRSPSAAADHFEVGGACFPKMDNATSHTSESKPPLQHCRSRQDSVMALPGREGQELTYGSGTGKAIGVFTSGGDSQGELCNHLQVTGVRYDTSHVSYLWYYGKLFACNVCIIYHNTNLFNWLLWWHCT